MISGQFLKNLLLGSSISSYFLSKKTKIFLQNNSSNNFQQQQQQQKLPEFQVDVDQAINQEDERRKFKLFALNQNRELAQEIAFHLNTHLSKLKIYQSYQGAESYIEILDSVRGSHVYLISSICPPINDSFMELLLTIGAMKQASAAKIVAVIPYFAYSRQSDLTVGRRRSVIASDLAKMLEIIGVDSVITINLQKPQMHGFFNVPIIELDALPLCVPYFLRKNLDNLTVVSIDDKIFGKTMELHEDFSRKGLKSNFGLVVKSVDSKKLDYIGSDLTGLNVLIVDNIVDAGDTLVQVSNYLKTKGAGRIFMYAPHGLLTQKAVKHVENSYVEELLLTNTIPLPLQKHSARINQISVGKLIAQAIAHVHQLSLHKKESIFDKESNESTN